MRKAHAGTGIVFAAAAGVVADIFSLPPPAVGRARVGGAVTERDAAFEAPNNSCPSPLFPLHRRRGEGRILQAALFVIALAIGLVPLSIERVYACACCSEQGQRFVGTVDLEKKRTDIDDMAFGERAELYVGMADIEDNKAVKDTTGSYKLSVSRSDTQMTFRFTDSENSHEGTLSFILPKKMTVFEVDPRELINRGGNPEIRDPVLYKEWRLTGPASGTGMFAPGMGKGQQITLIYQGRGNSCTDASSFTHWTLVVHGPVAEYHLFGILKNGEDQKKWPISAELQGFESIDLQSSYWGQSTVEKLISTMASDYVTDSENPPASTIKPLREFKLVEVEIKEGLDDPSMSSLQIRAVIKKEDANKEGEKWSVQEAARRWKCKAEPDADWTTLPCSP